MFDHITKINKIFKNHFVILLIIFVVFFANVGVTEAALTYVGTAENSGNSAAYNVDLSGLSLQEGDIVVVATGFVRTSNTDPGVGTAGYTEEADLYQNDTRDANFSINWKIMSSSPDTSVSCNGSGSATLGAVCVVHVWRGVDQGTPMDTAVTSVTGGNASNPNSPSITPTTSGAIVISAGLGTMAAVDNAVTAPTGYSNQADISVDPGSAATVGIASKAWTSGAEDPAAWTNFTTTTSDSWAAVTVALRPAFAPTITTSDATSVTQTGATFNGNITNTGGIGPTVRGFAWGTNSGLSGGDTATTTDTSGAPFGTGAFTDSSQTLTCNTTYYYRAYATNSIGTSYGAISNSFTTSACGSNNPTVSTDFVGNVSPTSATIYGTKTGGENATEHGFAYSTDINLATGVSTTTLGALSSDVEFSSNISSLSSNTTYYYRAYATGASGTGYGIRRSFYTGDSDISRTIHLFEGFIMKLFSGKFKLLGN